MYSFRDLVALRTIAGLRNAPYRVHLQELRQVAAWLDEHPTEAWSSLTFYVAGKQVYFDDPESGARLAARPEGRSVLPLSMAELISETAAGISRLKER